MEGLKLRCLGDRKMAKNQGILSGKFQRIGDYQYGKLSGNLSESKESRGIFFAPKQ